MATPPILNEVIDGNLYCLKCQKKTKTLNPFIKRIESKSKVGKQPSKYQIRGQCVKCKTEKSRFLSVSEVSYLPDTVKNIDENVVAGKGLINDILPLILPEDVVQATVSSDDEHELLDAAVPKNKQKLALEKSDSDEKKVEEKR